MRRRLQNVRHALIKTRSRDMLVIGLDMIALIKNRVINKGLDHEGNTFSPYSKAYAARKVKKNLDDKPFPLKNFKFTTRMMSNTTASVVRESDQSVTVRLAPVTPFEVEKLLRNEEREGKPIIEPSKKENAILERAITQRYRRILINNDII